jgi:hypothetical protein
LAGDEEDFEEDVVIAVCLEEVKVSCHIDEHVESLRLERYTGTTL